MILLFSRACGRAAVTLLLLVTCVFLGLRLTGDPAVLILGMEATPDDVLAYKIAHGLNSPLYTQYWRYLGELCHLDFGLSYVTGLPAIQLFTNAMGPTLRLMLPTALLTLLVGIPLGIVAALHSGTKLDRGLLFISVLGFAVPNFFFGLLLILFFSVWLGWLPTYGDASLLHYIMPVLTIATSEAAIFSRMARSAMLDGLSLPCVQAAHMRGFSRQRIIWLHALPNALISLLTVAGFFLGTLTAGAVITENIFSWPGIGRLLVLSVANRDIPVVQLIVLGVGCSLIIANLLVDLLSLVVNPKLRGTTR
ncbi:ABC transporter permease [Serratia sp. DD3]|uniref:ABC transporter permease n=1 Tax=Serratia sp. DD3 TaxID=1410619 RepID=UPI0003C4F500|nr:ABC transporter permease [Serratia sp. DD3]KEY60907.1 glutathione transport system permease protein GsiC [Serratia sp. DD3]